MEIIRHPGFLEIKLPDFFDLNVRSDNLSRTLSVAQIGTHNLLLDLTHRGDDFVRYRDESEVLHLTRIIEDAFRNLRDNIELIAFLVTSKEREAIAPYVVLLKGLGFDVRVFTHKEHAVDYLMY